jgi:protein MAK11
MSTKTPTSSSKPVKSILKTQPSKRTKTSGPSSKQISTVIIDPAPSAKSKGKQREKYTPVKATGIKQKPASEPKFVPSSTFKIVAGSYEKLLYGLEGTVSSSSSGSIAVDLKPIFIFPAHVSSIKAVAASPNGGKWLATGSSDEIVKVWDLKRKKEIGGLMHHEGEVHQFVFIFYCGTILFC